MCNEVKLAFWAALARGAATIGKLTIGTKAGRTVAGASAFMAGPTMAKGLKSMTHGRQAGKRLNWPINLARPNLRMPNYKTPRPVQLSHVQDKARATFNANFL